MSLGVEFRCAQNFVALLWMLSSSVLQALFGVFLWIFRILWQISVWRISIGCLSQVSCSNLLSRPQISLLSGFLLKDHNLDFLKYTSKTQFWQYCKVRSSLTLQLYRFLFNLFNLSVVVSSSVLSSSSAVFEKETAQPYWTALRHGHSYSYTALRQHSFYSDVAFKSPPWEEIMWDMHQNVIIS